MKCFVYILEGAQGRWYYGSSTNPARRLEQHNAGLVRSTIYGRPWRIIYVEGLPDKQSAQKREKYLKSTRNREYLKNLLGLNRPVV